jgi:hypothetical protein
MNTTVLLCIGLIYQYHYQYHTPILFIPIFSEYTTCLGEENLGGILGNLMMGFLGFVYSYIDTWFLYVLMEMRWVLEWKGREGKGEK